MSWVILTNRQESILETNLEILAWSEYLKQEIGVGYSQYIATSSGKIFVQNFERDEIFSQIVDPKPTLKYITKTSSTNSELLLLLKSPKIDYQKVFQKLILQLTYFYIGKIDANIIYSDSKTDQKTKKKIEKWRNDRNLFSGFDGNLDKLSVTLGLPVELLNLCMLGEIQDLLLNNSINRNVIDERSRLDWSLVLDNEVIKLFFEDLSPIKTEVEIENLSEIKGKSVFVINRKIQGVVGEDIMVVNMTNPDMVKEMLTKKAVITDEGGLLCHAAITSREFRIPCVIGTKIGTKVLKEGDLVEVDAKSGVVKILEGV